MALDRLVATGRNAVEQRFKRKTVSASVARGQQLFDEGRYPHAQEIVNINGILAKNPDLTITINRSDLEQAIMGQKTLEAQVANETAKIDGDAGVLQKLAATIVEFDPRFEISPGTKPAAETEQIDPYEAVPRQTIAE